jgi:hypothetical protein
MWDASEILPDTCPNKAYLRLGCSWHAAGTAYGDERNSHDAAKTLARNMEACKDVRFRHWDFCKIKPRRIPGLILFLDPPYRNTTKQTHYKTRFDFNLFWKQVEQWSALDARIYLTEWDVPPIPHERIWAATHGTPISSAKFRTEHTSNTQQECMWRILPPGEKMDTSKPITNNGPAAEYVPIDSIHPWKDNPRIHANSVEQVVKSIKRFGWGAVIVCRLENREIIAGHTRYEAAKRMNMDSVPVRFLDVTEQEAHILALADNKLGESSTWDDAMLRAVIGMMPEKTDLLTGTGFSTEDLAKLTNTAIPENKGDNSVAESEPHEDLYHVIITFRTEQEAKDYFAQQKANGKDVRALVG